MIEPIQVLVADSQVVFRTGLVSILADESDIVVVGEASDGLDAIDQTLQLKPHVIVLDILLPRCDGLQAMERIKEYLPDITVIFVSSSEREDDVFRALSSGAHGYLHKDAPHTEIVHAVRTAATGEVMLSPSIAAKLVSELRDDVNEPKLSDREREVLKLLSDGLTNLEIADHLYIGESTVRTYIYRILEKLNLKSRAEAAAYAARHQLSFARIAEGLKALNIQSHAIQQAIPFDVVAPATVEQLSPLTSTANPHVPAERKQVTTLFIELYALISTSESLNPEEMEILIRRCLDCAAEEIYRYEGTLAWLTGNAIMFLFGVPVSREDSALRALNAAMVCRDRLKEQAEQLREKDIELDVRIGVNTGLVVANKITSTLAMEYIPMGNTVALAATMWAMAEPGTIAVTNSTYQLTKEFFNFSYLGEASLRGAESNMQIYELLGPGSAETKFEAALARGLTEFVGRTRELETLKDCYDQVKNGQGQVVGIVGEAGIGKSRLILEFRNALPANECRYLEGRYLDYETGSMAQRHLLDLLKTFFNLQEEDQESLIKQKIEERVSQLGEDLKHILASLHEMLSLDVEDEEYLGLEPPQKRERILEAIKQLLVRDSQDKPMIIVLEDIHWIDKTSEELLSYTISWLSSARIMLILAYRTEYSHSWTNRSYYTQLSLGKLTPQSTTTMVDSILGDADVSPELMDIFFGKVAGNPLFVEEYVYTLLENESIYKRDHQYVLSKDISDIQIPQSIQGIIQARMDRLGPNPKQTLQMASIIGRDFNLPVLAKINGMGNELKSNLRRLQDMEFIYEKRLDRVPTYVFKHALTQEVAYNGLLLEHRRELHGKAAEAIEELYANTLDDLYEVLAHHYANTENWEKTYHYSKLSGDKALRDYSNWEAIRFYRQAIDALKKQPASRDNKARQLEICLLMHGPMIFFAYPEGSLEILNLGARMSTELGDSGSAAFIHGNIGMYHTLHGNTSLGLEHTQAAFEKAMKSNDIDIIVPAALNLCASYTPVGEHAATIEVASQAISLLEETQRELVYYGGMFNSNMYCSLLGHYASSLTQTGEFEEAQAVCQKALRFAHRIDHLINTSMIEAFYGIVFIIKGNGQAAIAHLMNSTGYLEQVDASPYLAASLSFQGFAYCLMGKMEEAADLADKGLKIHIESQITAYLSNLYYYKGIIEVEMGKIHSAHGNFEEALKLSLTNNEIQSEAMSRMYLGWTGDKSGIAPFHKNEESTLHGIKILEKLKLRPWYAMGYSLLGDLYADNGQQKKGLENLTKAKDMFQEMGMDYWLGKNQAVLDRLT